MEQFFIIDEQKRKLSVSRDVHNLWNRLKNKGEEIRNKQEEVGKSLVEINNLFSQKKYIGHSHLMTVAAQFNEKGQINEFGTQIELTNEFKNLDEKTKEVCHQMLTSFMTALNEGLGAKNEEVKSEIQKITKKITDVA